MLVGCGMGGSGFAIDASKYMLEDYGYQVIVNKSHVPPPYVGPGVPVLAVSYSGSTMETIECARRAIERGAHVCGVAGRGSRLHRLLEDHGFPVVPIETKGLPRTSLGLLVGSILGLLLPFREALAQVELISHALRVDWALEVSSRVASAVTDRVVPVVVACGGYAPLAWRWRSELAENAKLHALVEVYPEAGHNAINAWEHTGRRGRYVVPCYLEAVEDAQLLPAEPPPVLYDHLPDPPRRRCYVGCDLRLYAEAAGLEEGVPEGPSPNDVHAAQDVSYAGPE